MLQNSPIPRLSIFEFHDQSWFPRTLRQALTEWLRTVWEYSRAADVVAPLLDSAIRRSGAASIVDLCSGGTGPMIPVQVKLAAAGLNLPVLVTDKFPDLHVMADVERKTAGEIRGSSQSVDATDLPENLTGFRTLWNSFHHFKPDQAREILRNAYLCGQPIAIFEFTERSVPKVLLCFPASFLSVYFLIFRMRPRRVAWWCLTWILPVIPFIIAWDGLVSHLRSYTETELRGLIESFDSSNYTWETGKVRAPRAGLDVSYLIGLPTANAFHNIRGVANTASGSN